YAVTAAVTDKDGGSGSGGTSVVVNNVAPSDVSLSTSAATVNENDTLTLTGSFADAGTQDSHTVVINWGDGSAGTSLSLAAGVLTFSASHAYLDDNPTGTPSDVNTIAVTVLDDDTGAATGSTTVTVNNLAPVVTGVTGPGGPVAVGNATSVTVTFT